MIHISNISRTTACRNEKSICSLLGAVPPATPHQAFHFYTLRSLVTLRPLVHGAQRVPYDSEGQEVAADTVPEAAGGGVRGGV